MLKVKIIKVLLVVPSFDVEKFKGIARVSQRLAEGLKDKVDLEVYENYKRKKMYLNDLTVTPFKELTANADIIHSVVPESGAFFFLLKRLKRAKTITTFHDLIPLLRSKELSFKFQSLIKLYTLFMWKNSAKADVVTAVSSLTAKNLEKFFGRKADYIINPGVDERFKPIKVEKDKPTLGFFANFSYRKGLDKAIETFKLVKQKIDCRLIIAGGLLKTIYQRQFDISKMVKRLKDITVLGYVKEEDIVRLYNSFDIYLFPSIEEGFGIPILEAQKCGIPTLVFSWAKIPEETSKEAIKCKNVKEMAEKVIELLENPGYYRKVRKKGMEYASKFTWDNFVDQYLKIYG